MKDPTMKPAIIPLVDLKAQYETIRNDIERAMSHTMAQCAFVLGPDVERFERDFAAFCGAKYVVGCASGSDALLLALKGLGIGEGDDVIVPAFTFTATAEAVLRAGARPVFADVNERDLILDVRNVERAWTGRTRAVIAVHLFGRMADLDALKSFTRDRVALFIEDAAQAHGATWREKRAGSVGKAGCFSFYPGKNLGAYGDAGAVTTNDAELAKWLKKARNHGRSTKHGHEFPGWNSRLDGLQAAVLNAKLPYLEGWNARRRELAAYYERKLADLPGVRSLNTAAETIPAPHHWVVRLPERDRVARELVEHGVMAAVHYPRPLHRLPAFSGIPGAEASLPVCERAAREVLSLPLYPELGEEGVDHVVKTLAKVL